MGWGWGSGTEVWRTTLYLCELANPADVAGWRALMGAGVGKGGLEAPSAGFVGPSVEVFERLEIEGLVVICCRDCDFAGEVPEEGPAFLLGVLPVRGVALELAALEEAT